LIKPMRHAVPNRNPSMMFLHCADRAAGKP